MYAWLVKRRIRRNLERLRAGDPEPLLRSYADDVAFRFPGDHSWAADSRGKSQLVTWLERFIGVGLELHPEEIVVEGPPWNTRVCVRFTDHLVRGGVTVYENRGVIWGAMSWGKVTRYEVYEDTQKVAAFDRQLQAGSL